MRMFLISDNTIPNTAFVWRELKVLLFMRKEVLAALEDAVKNPDIGIIILTNKLAITVSIRFMNIKPAFTDHYCGISDRHGDLNISELISGYIREARHQTVTTTFWSRTMIENLDYLNLPQKKNWIDFNLPFLKKLRPKRKK